MEEQIIYRDMRSGEEPIVCELVRQAFNEFVAPDYGKTGVEEFFRFANPDAIKTRLKAGGFVLVANKSERLVGMLEFVPPDHIAMLFVSFRRQGIAKQLLACAIHRVRSANLTTPKLTVHSSRYAEPIYRKLGFHQVGDVTTERGITYIPMERDISEHNRLTLVIV